MKKLSETYKELGISFTYPIQIRDSKGNMTYYEDSDNFWYKKEYNADGNETYFENSNGYEEGTKRKIIKVKAELDDAAFACGDFIQKTLSILDAEFDKFFDKHKDMIEGLTEEKKRDWLFDYIWNGWDKDTCGFEETFSETLSNINGFEVNDDDNSMIDWMKEKS